MLAELTNARIPFITVLPSSADNHQLKALFYQKNFSLLVEEKYMDEKFSKSSRIFTKMS